jgi:hypothetical protein
MQLHEALDEMNKSYLPGVTSYYARHNPDPWSIAHEDLNASAKTHDDEMISMACLKFVKTCKDLISNYDKSVSQKNPVHISDASNMTEHQVWSELTRKDKVCYACESKNELSIKRDPENDKKVILLCKLCINVGIK